ncbi:hypothetical protein AVEN_173154-1 [Araneus ventricosus]|uniref:Uncharacterized protein n=1 Tax=Araneus ventricosus TaxID=182803 RepID=A0A4Y2KNI2_ARAVE|nr:hypothetical protein AVEN_173154-1 [Araneus ventricosus]
MINKPHPIADEGNQSKGSTLILCLGKMADIICCIDHGASYLTKVGWLMLVALSSDGNGKDTLVNTLMNSARSELHHFSILRGRIKFFLPPHGKLIDENPKVREAATIYNTNTCKNQSILDVGQTLDT